MEELLIKAIKSLVFLKKQNIITKYNLIDEEEIEFSFKINGFEEQDNCGVEDYKTITERIKKAEKEYWQSVKEENKFIDELNAAYTSVCCG